MADINHQPSEIWKPVVGYEGLYEVSSFGRVRSVDRSVPTGRAGHAPLRLKGRVLKLRYNRQYPAITLHKEGGIKGRTVHSLVLEAFVGPRPPKRYGCHNDGDPRNNHIDNLRWDTQSNNLHDAVKHGRHRQVLKRHCPHGHEYTSQNTVFDAGSRKCRTCLRARNMRKRNGRPLASEIMRSRTHCPYGHPYTAENTYIQPKSKARECKICRRRRGVEQCARRKAERTAQS